jgi:hypothetical protein
MVLIVVELVQELAVLCEDRKDANEDDESENLGNENGRWWCLDDERGEVETAVGLSEGVPLLLLPELEIFFDEGLFDGVLLLLTVPERRNLLLRIEPKLAECECLEETELSC